MANKKVPVYYIGVHFKENKKRPIFNVKGVPYRAPENIGDVVMVNESDVQSLILKAQVELRGKGTVESFTTNPSIAGAIKEQYLAGKKGISVQARMSVTDALSMVSPEMLKDRIMHEFTPAELEALLKQMKPDITTAEDEEARIIAEAESLAEAEEEPEDGKQKRKRGRPRTEDTTLGELLAEDN